MQHNNGTGKMVGGLPPELEGKVLAALPQSVRHWVLYDAPWDVCVAEIFRVWRAGTDEASILRHLRTTQRQECRAVYGPGHPQASLF